MQGELIFQSEEIRKLFSTENLIGQSYNPKNFDDIIKLT